MALILNIETSTEVCSAVIARDGLVGNVRENIEGQNHAKLLTVFIEELLSESGLTMDRFDAVAVSGGPGSYTGLRIGVSVAKGICYASDLPMIAITSLEAMAYQVLQGLGKLYTTAKNNTLLCPMIDARRMEVYTAFFDMTGTQIRDIKADILDHQSYRSLLDDHPILFFGNGSSKFREVINHPNALFIDGVITSAKNMAQLAERDLKLNKFVDKAYYEPFYLKDFVATIPVKNVFKTDSNL